MEWTSTRGQDHLPLLRRRLRRAREGRRRTAQCPSAATPSIPPISAGSAPRARRWARRSGSTAGCSIPRSTGDAPSWDEALDLVARRFSQTIAEHGPDAVAFYVSGQLLTEDYYVANKLMKGFIGSANIDTNSRLCMASSVAGHSRAFGADTVPGSYEDLELADLVVLVGSNLAWCHPVLYQRIAAAKAERPEMKVVRDRSAPHRDRRDRRPASGDRARTATSRCSTACSPISASTARSTDDYVAAHTTGFARGACRRRGARPCRHCRSAPACSHDELRPLLRPVRRDREGGHLSTARASTSRRRAPTRSTPSSTAISPPAASAGRAWGRSRSPASPTRWAGARSAGWPTCSPRIWSSKTPSDRDRVQRFWQAPAIADKPGLKAVDLFRGRGRRADQGALDHGDQPGRFDAGCRRRRAAIEACPFVVVSDCCASTDTDAPRPCPAARRRLGREGRHGHQFRAPHLAPAALSWPRPARRGPTGGSSPKSRGAWALARPSPMRRRREIFAEHAALSALRERWRARLRHRRLCR